MLAFIIGVEQEQVVQVRVSAPLPGVTKDFGVGIAFTPAPGVTRKQVKQLERELPIRMRLFLADLEAAARAGTLVEPASGEESR